MVYTLAQCTPDLPWTDCNHCLRTAIAELPFCCAGLHLPAHDIFGRLSMARPQIHSRRTIYSGEEIGLKSVPKIKVA
ncbi:cysteine-rich receptor-like protein kinase 14 isoform X2 [Malania oleifera]|uniref:cysteine-rich receptor-like protein kinase 14 isoform X2 n=1 Tax=Malania oleifera TaxID=397392 RepID=UPI0025AE212C|nr:cysteine-rich receptor-like protein kinase 14 isoform X2 [Malania oleifera]